jgi:hypothetical protein
MSHGEFGAKFEELFWNCSFLPSALQRDGGVYSDPSEIGVEFHSSKSVLS